MRNKYYSLLLIAGMAMLLAVISSVAIPTSVSGHERDSGYQLVVTQAAAETAYGADTSFTAVLSFPLAEAPIDALQFHFVIDDTSYGISYGQVKLEGQSNGQATFLLANATFLEMKPIGQYTVSATYFVANTQTTIQGNSLIHTVGKGDIGGMKCLYTGTSVAPGQTITIFVQYETNSIDPHIGAYRISFIGPASVNYPNLTLDGADHLTVQAPSVTGNYTFQCRFNGSALYNPTQQPDQPFVVSAGRQPGPIRLYSSPTTLVPGHVSTLYVVVPTTPGLPAPTGTIIFYYDNYPTNPVPLGQGGSVTVTLTLPGYYPTPPLSITYSGDDTYARESDSFSLTNLPITGQVPPAAPVTIKSGNGNTKATVTPATSVTATAIAATSTTTPPTPTSESAVAATGATTQLPPTSPSSHKNGSANLPLVAILLVLGIGGSAAGIWYIKMRGKAPLAPVTANQTPLFSETTAPFQPPLDGDITQL